MRKVLVFTEAISGSTMIRKTVVVSDTVQNPATGAEEVTNSAFVIILDTDGLLHEAYEIQFDQEIPEAELTDPNIIPIPVPGRRKVLLNLEHPEQSVSVPE
ncbi:MAG: hypothetical protein H6563_13845 [Lewinellaceae bacterium]|nr:hypothetical protein [Lewinellaceae bacterium]